MARLYRHTSLLFGSAAFALMLVAAFAIPTQSIFADDPAYCCEYCSCPPECCIAPDPMTSACAPCADCLADCIYAPLPCPQPYCWNKPPCAQLTMGCTGPSAVCPNGACHDCNCIENPIDVTPLCVCYR